MEKDKKSLTINSKDVMINSANKMGRHLDIVKSGCGVHKSKKDYNRKEKHVVKYI